MIHHHLDRPTRSTDPHYLPHGPGSVGSVVNHSPRIHDVERAVVKRQMLAVANLHIGGTEAIQLESITNMLNTFSGSIDSVGSCTGTHPLDEICPGTDSNL